MNVTLLRLAKAGKFDRLRVVDVRREDGMDVGRGTFVLVTIQQRFFFRPREIRGASEFNTEWAEQFPAISIIVCIDAQLGMSFVVVVTQFHTVSECRRPVLAFDVRGRIELVVVVPFDVDTFEKSLQLY